MRALSPAYGDWAASTTGWALFGARMDILRARKLTNPQLEANVTTYRSCQHPPTARWVRVCQRELRRRGVA